MPLQRYWEDLPWPRKSFDIPQTLKMVSMCESLEENQVLLTGFCHELASIPRQHLKFIVVTFDLPTLILAAK